MIRINYFFILLFLILSISLKGQDNDRIIVKYKDGSLPGVLPSGVEFLIEGKAVTPTGKTAKAVQLTIDYQNKDVFNSNVWTRSDNNDIFRFVNTYQLYPGREYKFKFVFYTEDTINVEIAEKILDSIITKTANRFKKKKEWISLTEGKQIIQDETKKIGADYPYIGYIEHDTLVKGVKLLTIDKEYIKKILDYSTNLRNIDLNESNIIKSFKVLRDTIYKSKSPEISDFRELISSANNYRELDLQKIDTQKLSEPIKLHLKDLIKKIHELDSSSNAQNDTLKSIVNKLKTAKVISKENNLITSSTNNLKTSESSIDRLGLRYGIACSIFDNGKNVSLVNIVTTRFYFCPIDKTMNSPYPDWHLSRLSLNIGAALSNMKYNGVDLRNTDLGLKLVTGFSYDFNKNFSFSSGTIWYNIDEGTPFNRMSKTKAVFYTAFTFDFNLIENLKK